MTWLIYIRGLRSPCIQKVFGTAEAPFLDEGVRAHVLAKYRLEEADSLLSLAELTTRFPAPEQGDET